MSLSVPSPGSPFRWGECEGLAEPGGHCPKQGWEWGPGGHRLNTAPEHFLPASLELQRKKKENLVRTHSPQCEDPLSTSVLCFPNIQPAVQTTLGSPSEAHLHQCEQRLLRTPRDKDIKLCHAKAQTPKPATSIKDSPEKGRL